MTRAPKRRWFRWSLRTMFVVVTVAAVVLGWSFLNWKWIADRQRAREWLEARRGFVVYAGQSFAMQSEDGTSVQSLDGGITSPSGRLLKLPAAPWSLRILGDQTAHFIVLHAEVEGPPLDMAEVEAKLPELRRLFPECDIRVNFIQRNSPNNIKPLKEMSVADLEQELRFWRSQPNDPSVRKGIANHIRDIEREIEVKNQMR